jgi:hypothetical protein
MRRREVDYKEKSRIVKKKSRIEAALSVELVLKYRG